MALVGGMAVGGVAAGARPRAVGLAAGLALGIATVVLNRATAPPDVLADAPPLRAEEASVWLARRGALTAAPLFGHPDWAPLAADGPGKT